MCISNYMNSCNGLQRDSFSSWKAKIIEKVDSKITSIKTRIKIHKTNPVLKDPETTDYLKSLHDR